MDYDGPSDPSPSSLFNYSPIFSSPQFTQYNPLRAGATVLGAGIVVAAVAATGGAVAPLMRGPVLGAAMEFGASQLNGYAASEVTSVAVTEGYGEFLEGLEDLGALLKSGEVPEVAGPEIPWQ